jgi:sugar phosphate isomerase/epimerase
MKLGVYTAILHDRDLPAALTVIRELGLTGAEVNVGGFIGTPHIPVDDVLTSATAREDYLGVFAEHGVELTGLNVDGNPLHADPVVREKHSADLQRAVEIAGALGVGRIVAMSGLPWWPSGRDLAELDRQPLGQRVPRRPGVPVDLAVPYWTDIDRRARDHDVKVAIEMHPQNLVFNPATLQRLVERAGATHVGAEMDPSHLFWQGIDPVAAIDSLGELVLHAAAKDTRINDACRVNGVLDDRFRRLRPDEERVTIGGDHYVNEWPQDSSWDFVAVGRGHDQQFWTSFLAALHRVDP